MTSTPNASLWRRLTAGPTLSALGLLAILIAVRNPPSGVFLLAAVLVASGVTQWLFSCTASNGGRGQVIRLGGLASVAAGLLLFASERIIFSAIVVLLGVGWVIDGLIRIGSAWRGTGEGGRAYIFIDGLCNVLVGLAIAVQWPLAGVVSFGWATGLRLLSAGWAFLFGVDSAAGPAVEEGLAIHPDQRLGLPPHRRFAELRERFDDELRQITRTDRYWAWTFVVVFFAIHVGRMHAEWNLVGLLSPAVAVLGDVALALLIAYVLILPVEWVFNGVVRWWERRAWRREFEREEAGRPHTWWSRFRATTLTRRARRAYRNEKARGSPTAMVGWGLRLGLPLTAVLIALNPIWGFSWYFNSENWVTGAWEVWAAHRTDTWREHMVRAVRGDGDPATLFRLAPDGIDGAGDFSFIVIGDPGEGDPSQFCLKNQLLAVGGRDDVKFLVVSSDVIYPSGSMADYEPKFYLPFKGFRKPVYAIPGNHDWYDSGEAFFANFLEPGAARAAIRARREADLRLTTTTEAKIDGMVEQAARLRAEYQLQSAQQKAPYSEIQTDRFALLMVDTGILKSVDDDQWRWLNGALDRARGKFIFVIIGHPLFAGGHDQRPANPELAKVAGLLAERGAVVVMGGDTHDFEYYREPLGGRAVHHFVNGGGGAYLSIGTALDWPAKNPVEDAAHYPRADAVIEKLDRETPTWKRPLWWWVKRWHAWPSSVETMASAFDYNRAPFFQSFMEVRVERSANRVRLLLYGAGGRVRWNELQRYGAPAGESPDGFVEFSIPLPP
jgi:uncharacterized membrane protein HdeD (DUF308 family)